MLEYYLGEELINIICLIELIRRIEEIIIIRLIKTNQYSEHRKKIDTFKIKVKLLKYAHLLIRSNNINRYEVL